MLRPAKALLIGECAAGIKLRQSRWVHECPPARPAQAEAAALQYLELLRSAHIAEEDARPELEGAALVCQCKRGDPCHGDSLVQWFFEKLSVFRSASPRQSFHAKKADVNKRLKAAWA